MFMRLRRVRHLGRGIMLFGRRPRANVEGE
jgi:hypothetical protein